MLKYKWQITPRTNQLLIELEATKIVFNSYPGQPHLELNLRRQSLLRSAVFSARVEGFSDTVNSPKKESQNLLSAYLHIYSEKAPQKLSLSLIRRLHRLVLKKFHRRQLAEPTLGYLQPGGRRRLPRPSRTGSTPANGRIY